MDVEHVMPPANSIEAMLAIARLNDAAVDHLRSCSGCRIAWYRAGAFRAGCTDPRMGGVVMGSIGRTLLPTAAQHHIECCLACRLLVLSATRVMNAGSAGLELPDSKH